MKQVELHSCTCFHPPSQSVFWLVNLIHLHLRQLSICMVLLPFLLILWGLFSVSAIARTVAY